jgi:hypothetical protein
MKDVRREDDERDGATNDEERKRKNQESITYSPNTDITQQLNLQ